MLVQYKELLYVWTRREIQIRYKQSILGGAWAILQPLSLMIIFTAVFGYFVRVPTDGIPYPLFSYSALLPWTLFSTSISFAAPSLINNINLVTKIYFPREIFPAASTGAALFDYVVASSLFLVLMLIYKVPFGSTLVFLPIILVIQILLMLGISFIASAVIVRFRDIRFVVPLGLQLWMYSTPVVYPLSLVPERFHLWYMLNPMASLIDGYRRVTLFGQAPQWNYLGVAAIISAIIFILGYRFFKREEEWFADVI